MACILVFGAADIELLIRRPASAGGSVGIDIPEFFWLLNCGFYSSHLIAWVVHTDCKMRGNVKYNRRARVRPQNQQHSVPFFVLLVFE